MRMQAEAPQCIFNPLTPNDPYRGSTAPLTSKRCILYIYSTNIGTGYFKHGIYSPFISLQNAVCFIIVVFNSCFIHILYTECAKIKKNNSGAKRLKLNMFRMLIHPSSGACDLFVELFHGLYCSGGVVPHHTTPAKPQRNTNTHRTRAIQPMK